jgi:hypothetical protein
VVDGGLRTFPVHVCSLGLWRRVVGLLRPIQTAPAAGGCWRGGDGAPRTGAAKRTRGEQQLSTTQRFALIEGVVVPASLRPVTFFFPLLRFLLRGAIRQIFSVPSIRGP